MSVLNDSICSPLISGIQLRADEGTACREQRSAWRWSVYEIGISLVRVGVQAKAVDKRDCITE
jgi:hypothetical protein